MLNFECSDHQIKRAVISGAMNDIVCELVLITTFIYGALKKRNKDAGEHFKFLVTELYKKEDSREVIFDESIYAAIAEDGEEVAGEVKRRDEYTPEEALNLIQQVVELDSLSEDEKAEAVRVIGGLADVFSPKEKDEDDEGEDIHKAISERSKYESQ